MACLRPEFEDKYTSTFVHYCIIEGMRRFNMRIASGLRIWVAWPVVAFVAVYGQVLDLKAQNSSATAGTTPAAVSTNTAAVRVGGSASKELYMVVDLSGGMAVKEYPVSYLAEVPRGGWSDDYKTVKLVMRRIEPGVFMMGSPTNEVGRNNEETQHEVRLTKAFYIGVFEVTQKQWERVMGAWPSFFCNETCRDARPVERLTYNDIRGAGYGSKWPATNSVDMASFIGKLRMRTGLVLDLPTEAQWEYACRAGTVTALNSGKNLTTLEICPNMAEVGRYRANTGEATLKSDTGTGTAKVGSYLPNAWGLYDMHGNVLEWCLDWLGDYPGSVQDPVGIASGSSRVKRGGSWFDYAGYCRSANRYFYDPSHRYYYYGFRVAMLLP